MRMANNSLIYSAMDRLYILFLLKLSRWLFQYPPSTPTNKRFKYFHDRGAAAPQIRHSRKGVRSPIESVILSHSSICPGYLSSAYSLDSFCSSFQERDLADSISWEAVAFALLPDTTSARGHPDRWSSMRFRFQVSEARKDCLEIPV